MLHHDDHDPRQHRDHFLLARGFLRGCEIELSDLKEWIQQEILAVKENAQQLESEAGSDLVQRKARGILDLIAVMDLKDYNECIRNIEAAFTRVKVRDYQNVFDVRTETEREMMRLRDMARGLLEMRNTLDILSETQPQPPIDEITKILFLAAEPTDASRLRLGEELREIQEKLRLANFRDKFGLVQRMAVRPEDISQAILDEKPKIVHFSGHGTIAGGLCFENAAGESLLVEPDSLAGLFALVSNDVDCVILSACYSETQAIAIASHIKYVIGMNQAIGDAAAISFGTGFYQALGAGKSVEDAFEFGRVQIRMAGLPDDHIPVLKAH